MAGATRGAGRGTAVALGEAGATVYCTGRTTTERRSEYDRPETIEETAELVDAAGGDGDRRRGRPPRAGAGRGARRSASTPSRAGSTCWSTTSGAASSWPSGTRRCGSTTSTSGLRMLRLAIDTHLITSHFALALLIRRPGGLVVEMTDGTREYNADALPALGVLRPGQDVGHPARVRAGQGARAARLHRRGADAGLDALGDDARDLRGHRGQLARRRRAGTRTSPRSPRARASWAARSPPSPPTRTSTAATAARSPPAAWRASTASPTSTAPSPTAGATWSRSRTRACPPDPTGYR